MPSYCSKALTVSRWVLDFSTPLPKPTGTMLLFARLLHALARWFEHSRKTFPVVDPHAVFCGTRYSINAGGVQVMSRLVPSGEIWLVFVLPPHKLAAFVPGKVPQGVQTIRRFVATIPMSASSVDSRLEQLHI